MCGGSYLTYAQALADESAARKFDEFKVDVEKGIDVEARLVRYARQLKREPQTKAYIIAYSPRIRNREGSSYWSIAENQLLTTKAQISHAYGIKEGRIIGIDGGIREDATVELWILPVGAKPPAPRDEFQAADVIECCLIRVEGEIYVYKKETPLKFKAVPSLGSCPQITSYHWSVSSGKIIGGQGTDTILIDASGTADRNVTAIAAAEGLSSECINRDAYTTAISIAPYKLFEFEEKYSEDLKTRLDLLVDILQKEPFLKGYIIVYGARVGRSYDVRKRRDRTQDYLLNFRGLILERFSVVEGGYRENPMFEIWLIPRDAPLPSATPTVDRKYVRFTREVGSPDKISRRHQ